MKNILKLLIFYFFLFCQVCGNAQIKNGAVFRLVGGSLIQGELLSSNSNFEVRLIDNSIYEVKKNSVTKAFLPEEITLFANGKYNLKKGFLFYYSSGFGTGLAGLNLAGGYQFGNQFEAGGGFGFHTNLFSIPVGNSINTFFNINSYPIFISGKYFFLKEKLLKPYAKLLVGLNNNQTDWGISKINNGFMFETGFGLAFSGRKKTRFFTEILQYNTKVKGIALSNQWDPNTGASTNTDINFNLWINKIIIRFGLFIQILN